MRLRIANYKRWMRLALGAWLVALGSGAWTYRTLNGGSVAEVEWTDQGGRHSVQADDGSFQSETMTAGGTFNHRFDRAGVYRYFCEFHGAAGGHDMAGVIIVK